MTLDHDVDPLARRARDGDERAFEALVRRLVRPALAAAWEFVPEREDAEDVVQEAFARVWRRLRSYDPARPFAPWFFTILRNVARSTSRADRRWNTVSLTEEVADPAVFAIEPEPESSPEWIESAIDALSPMQRACFRLTGIEGFTSAEVAAMLGVSDATVRVHAYRARAILRERLGTQRADRP